MRFIPACWWLVFGAWLAAAQEPPPKTPAQSLNAIHVRPDMQVDVAACEPLVRDPIAIAWGPDGRLWVVEMGDYPLGVDGKGQAGGRIRILEDVDGDGRYDKGTLFLDNLPFPTGVLPWRKGALITCAPDILYAEDTDGDGKADKVEILYTGFPQRNQQHRVNGLRWGLDNWVHCANGDGGVGGDGQVKSLRTGRSFALGGRDFRIRPDDGSFEPQTGKTQFGRHPDDWGNWFGSNNAQPLYHFVLADEYLRRNPQLIPPEPLVHLVPSWSVPLYSLARPVAVRGQPAPTQKVYPTGFTSACSGMIYRDDLLGPEFAGNAFICDPATSLVHRQVLSPSGVTFSSRRPADEEKSEFFASRDSWTRPVMVQAGPDGALWVVDMYRLMIEHPQWIALEIRARVDLRAGHDLGRIYRIYPFDKRPRPLPRLDKLDTAGLVAALDSPSGWQRDLAQQMLLWRADQTALEPLGKLARTAQRPQARLHALCTLDGLGALTAEALWHALQDQHPGVRRHAVRLSERLVNQSPPVGLALLKLVKDADAPVRLQLACTLGQWGDRRAVDSLAELALDSPNDPYLLAGVLSSVKAADLEALLAAVLSKRPGEAPPPPLVEKLLGMAVSGDNPELVARVIQRVASAKEKRFAPWQFAAIAGLCEALDRQRRTLEPGGAGAIALPPVLRERLRQMSVAARGLAVDKQAPIEQRLTAVRLLGRGLEDKQLELDVLAGLLVPQTAVEVQRMAVATLGRSDERRVLELLLRDWASHSPTIRTQILDTLLTRDRWVEELLQRVADRRLPAADFDAARSQRLLQHRQPAIRALASKAFAVGIQPDRQRVVEAYKTVYSLQGEAAKGKPLFEKRCAICHRLGQLGHEVGPELTPYAQKPLEALLVAVLDPNRAIEPRYLSYLAATRQGRVFTGILTTETSNSVTLLEQENKRQVLLRSELEELRSTGKSLMPEGLEKDLSPQDLADLAAFLRSGAHKSDK